MKNFQLTFALLGAIFLAAGCGGGSSSTGVNIPTAAIQITSSNAQTVASGANAASESSARQGSSAATTVVGVVTQQAGQIPSALNIATSGLGRVLTTPLPTATVIGATSTAYFSCSTGLQVSSSAADTFTFTYSVAGSTIAAGDSVSIYFNSCVDTVTGDTTNGGLGIAITSLSGTFGTAPSSAAFTATFSNLTVTNAGASASLNGDMTIAATSSTTAPTLTATISGNSLTITDSVQGSIRLTSYNETYTYDNSSTAYTYSVNTNLAGTVMNGSVNIATTTTFSGTGTGNPTAGVMTITGTGGSYVMVTANSNGTDVTLNGSDGTTPFGPTVVAWSAL